MSNGISHPGRLGRVLAGAALAWSVSSPVLAVNTSGYDVPYVFGGGVYEIEDSKRDSGHGAGFWLGGGYPLPNLPGEAIELSLRTLGRDRDQGGDTDRQHTIFAHWVHSFGDGIFTNAVPYALAGLGAIREDVVGSKHEHFGIDAGLGLLVPIPIGGWAIRAEAAAQAQDNHKSVPDEDYVIDFNLRLALQIPLGSGDGGAEPHLEEPVECPVRVVDPVTGRSDCGADSDQDHVLDSYDMCPGTSLGTEVDSKGCPLATLGDADGDGILDAADACPNSSVGLSVDATGCIVEQTTTLKGVRFETASAKLTPGARTIVDEVARTLKSQPKVNAEVGGHTDDVGNDAYNLILSSQRAESVRQHLIGKGVAPERLTAKGYGETQPIASNDTPEGRDANRRVDFKVTVK
jgi:outer membrane protein OmpA-like peptidoglycan-associated protein